MAKLNPTLVAWGKERFDGLKVGDVWYMPTDGLIYRKMSPTSLLLIKRVAEPAEYDAARQAKMRARQNGIHELTREYLAAAGITVEEPS